MQANLFSQKTVVPHLVNWWRDAACPSASEENEFAFIEVREDALFKKDKWLGLGQIQLHLPSGSSPEHEDYNGQIQTALLGGGYTWEIPGADTIVTSLRASIFGEEKHKESSIASAKRVRDAIAFSFLRLGLATPLLDPQDFSELPFRRPVTLVADTNAVLQGGVDFSVRSLYPMARLRIPEPVHAELSNQAQSYLSRRRSQKSDDGNKNYLDALRERLTSQGGLRALLRVQLQSDVEIERLQVEAQDPRHYDVAGDKGKGGDRSAIPDRMILEAALRHRALIAPGHKVRIMTSDQGMARSALIEGISPLYFPPRKWESFFGRTYLGAVFSPFPVAMGSIWHRIPLTEILWELAVCFGCVRLRSKEEAGFTVTATRYDLPWSSFHARGDLLWIESSGNKEGQKQVEKTVVPDDVTKVHNPKVSQPKKEHGKPVKRPRIVAPKISADKLVGFWAWMDAHRSGKVQQVADSFRVSNETARDYIRVMASGGFIIVDGENIQIEGEKFDPLWQSLRSRDWDALRSHLLLLPAFSALCEELSESPAREVKSIRADALPAFQRVGEICGAILNIPEVGLCFCDPQPTIDDFCIKSLEAYKESIRIDPSAQPLVQAGLWMEILATQHRVHPLFTPELLQEAITTQRLSVEFEGSQPFREKRNHAFREIVWQKDRPELCEIPLYQGDFLAKSRASVHLKVEPFEQ